MTKPFSVNISGLRNRPGSRQPIEISGPMSDLVVSGSAVPDGATIVFKGQVEAMEAAAGAVVSGVVVAPWQGDCCRCLGPAAGVIEAEVREIFEPDFVEGETYLLQGEGFDLDPLIRESIMLDLPEAPLCKQDCKGLCANCGTNKNENDCACDNEVLDLRWAALDALKSRQQ